MTQQIAASAQEIGSAITRLARPASMSTRIWNLDWSAVLPWAIGDVSVEHGTFADALPFMGEHYPAIFGVEPDRFFIEEMTEAKQRFCEEMDVFVFHAAERPIGICTGHPSDWSTYYVRTFAILPEFRERRFATDFEKHLSGTLAGAGVARMEADCSIANRAMTKLFVSQGFLMTSTVASERWGTMLRFTKFLNEDAARVFHRQFVNVPLYGRNAHNNERRES
jgi:hypothetical protein